MNLGQGGGQFAPARLDSRAGVVVPASDVGLAGPVHYPWHLAGRRHHERTVGGQMSSDRQLHPSRRWWPVPTFATTGAGRSHTTALLESLSVTGSAAATPKRWAARTAASAGPMPSLMPARIGIPSSITPGG